MEIITRVVDGIVDTTVTIEVPPGSDDAVRIETALRSLDTPGYLSRLVGASQGEWRPLEVARVMRFFTSGKDVYAHTTEGEWKVNYRIRDLARALDPALFVQINQGEIVNIRAISRMDLSLTSTIGLELVDSTRCHVSRRSLANFRQALNFTTR